MNYYTYALACYKKQLSYSWVISSRMQELKSYDNIGMTYFYLQNLEKANYYHTRAMNGDLEQDHSFSKQMITKHFKNKKKLIEIENIRDNFQLSQIMKADKTKSIAGSIKKELIKASFKLEVSGDYVLTGADSLEKMSHSILPSPASIMLYQR